LPASLDRFPGHALSSDAWCVVTKPREDPRKR